jgi:hypothetical protein
LVDNNSDIHFLDITCVNPASKTALSYKSDKIRLTGASNADKVKNSKYKKFLTSDAFSRFKPFSLEITGAFSSISSSYIDSLCGFGSPNRPFDPNLQLLRKSFFSNTSRILVKCNALIIRKCRSSACESSYPSSQSSSRSLAEF